MQIKTLITQDVPTGFYCLTSSKKCSRLEKDSNSYQEFCSLFSRFIKCNQDGHRVKCRECINAIYNQIEK